LKNFHESIGSQRVSGVPPLKWSTNWGITEVVAWVDPALMSEIWNIPLRKRELDIHHVRWADDLGRGFEIAKAGVFCHSTPGLCTSGLKPVSSDKAGVRNQSASLNPVLS
jgi:hypothetical protein